MTVLAAAATTAAPRPSAAARVQEPTPCAACIVLLLPALIPAGQPASLPQDLQGVEILVRAAPDAAAARPAIDAIRARRGTAGLWLDALSGSDPDQALLAASSRVVLDVASAGESSDELAFRLKTRLTELRTGVPGQQLGLHARPHVLDDLLRRDLGAYVDFVVRPAAARPAFPGSIAASPAVLAVEGPGHASGVTPARWIVALPDDPEQARQLIDDVRLAASVVVEGLIRGGIAEVRCGEQRAATYLNPETLETVAVLQGCRAAAVSVVPDVAGLTRIELTTGETVVRVPSPEGRFAQGVDVVADRTLSVREIIARHQAAAARQRRQVRQSISAGHMTLTFEAPGFPAPLAITTEAVLYTAPGTVEIEQREIRVNGIAFEPNRIPRLPLLEPERVASPPLEISLTDVYRYSLAGLEQVDGVRCYVIRFEPVDRKGNLFAGRAWISMDEFAMVKVSAVQRGLRGAIVSSEQSDEFRRAAGSVWLLARSEVHQIYEGAGHRTPIHRVLAVDRHEINPPDFAERRQAAYRSPSVMLRDTPQGFRYLRRERTDDPAGTTVSTSVTGAAERVRTLAVGVIVDPNISRPLPFAGLSYVDFNLFGTGTQMDGFFGGTYGQLALAVPSLGGTRWQLNARAFGIASSYNDRAFVDGREDYRANIAQRPAHASLWLLRPMTPRVSARGGYELDYTAYGRVDSTSPAFVVPAAQAAHAVRLALEAQWHGWSASTWWSGARRSGWRAWGEGRGEYARGHRDYQRFGASVSRSFVTSPRLVGRVEAAWMGGHDQDRFSRYSFGSFDNRLRGYPSALIRYDHGAVLRGAAAWAAGRRLRLDGFVDTAYVRDPGFGARPRSYTGVGAAAEVPAPFGTLVAVEWGYGFQGVNGDGRRGTQVVRVSGYKMF